jgi:acetoin utilization deacetylase AcuC-like enzyme
MLDADTVVSPKSGEAALRAVGAILAAVDDVFEGRARNGFCATRPPGHHAEAAQSMGFCLFNNVVIAAHHARRKHGIRRIAVMDFDVHHGNGTQHLFQSDRDLFYGSTHQMPLYPGTGAVSERGVGNIVNAPLRPGAGSDEFRSAMTEIILPAITTFDPELLLISAGFDAHRDDPLGGLGLVEEDYAWATAELCRVADECCDGRVVSTLEGGYDLEALRDSAAAHVAALMAA